MARGILAILVLLVFAVSCTQRTICPAYQSAFIYDKNELRKKFSYFVDDTIPKVYTASKNKYLIAEAMPYQKKVRTLNTVPMKDVLVTVPDSITGKQDSVITEELHAAARSVIDSTFIVDLPADTVETSEEDSTYVISKDREIRVLKQVTRDTLLYDSVKRTYVHVFEIAPQKPKYRVTQIGFNTEQDNYMWYLRRSLVLPDVRIARIQDGGEASKAGGHVKKQKGGFFKNLFRKKKRNDIDSAELEVKPRSQDEFDFVDTTAVDSEEFTDESRQQPTINENDSTQITSDTTPKKDRRSRKKKKKSRKDSPQSDTPAKKKQEDEDDGF